MATFAELKTRVQNRIIDAPASVVSEVPGLVNAVIREAQTLLNFPVMKATAEFITATNVRVLGAVPSDFKSYRGKPYTLGYYGAEARLRILNPRQAAAATVSLNSIGGPYGILETDPSVQGVRNWEIYPLSAGVSDYPDLQYRVSVPYWRYLTDLVTDADYNWFTVNCAEWIVAKTTAKGYELDWNSEGAVTFETLAKDEWMKIKNKAIMELLQGRDTLVVNGRANDDQDYT